MSEKTDETLVLLAKQGDDEAMAELFARYKSLVNKLSRTYFLAGGDVEDLIQEGMIGLYKAIQNYKNKKKASFKTFATICIKHQIQTAVKIANAEKNKVLSSALSIGEQSDFDDENDSSADIILPSQMPSPDSQVIERENQEELLSLVNEVLSLRERQVLGQYLQGYSYNEIASNLGESKKSIDNALTRIKNKLQFLKKDFR